MYKKGMDGSQREMKCEYECKPGSAPSVQAPLGSHQLEQRAYIQCTFDLDPKRLQLISLYLHHITPFSEVVSRICMSEVQ